jgi:hypothetical protein
MRIVVASILTFVVAALAGVGNAMGQTARSVDFSTVDVWGAVTGATSGPGGTLVTSYSPPLLFDGDFVSHGGQTLAADTGFTPGASGGINIFPSRHVGLQVLVDRVSSTVSGVNGPYALMLQYVSRVPPNDQPQNVVLNRSLAWPDTSGSLTQLTVAINGVVRFGRSDRVTVTISGGPAFYRLSGDVEPVGFSAFQLGGHSVLFENEYRLRVALDPAQGVGVNGGGELSAAVAPHLAVIAGYRFFAGKRQNVAVNPSVILNAGDITLEQPLADIALKLSAPDISLSVTGSRFIVGLKIVL